MRRSSRYPGERPADTPARGFRMARCINAECGRRFRVWFIGQTRCMPCAAEAKRKARAKVQPDLPIEADGSRG